MFYVSFMFYVLFIFVVPWYSVNLGSPHLKLGYRFVAFFVHFGHNAQKTAM